MKNTPSTITSAYIFLLLIAPVASAQTTHHVDADAPGRNDGTSWIHAYTDLQNAFLAARDGDRILIAAGTYKPAQPSAGRSVSFELVSGVGVYGGYAGYGEPDPGARDFERYESVLSGDLNGDDGPDSENNDENSYNVIRAVGMGERTILDGLTITGGNANGPDWRNHHAGGGYVGMNCTMMFRNCRFIKNHARFGGGVFALLSEGTYESCSFLENTAEFGGGGMYRKDSVVTLLDCEFIRNTGWDGGGVAIVWRGESTIVNCRFESNCAFGRIGGGLRDEGSSATLIGCTFIGNEAPELGGGYTKVGGSVALFDCFFEGNVSAEGGGIGSYQGRLDLVRCLLIDNAADEGGGLWNNRSSVVTESVFVSNRAGSGGAIHDTFWLGVRVRDSLFTDNVATNDGGAVVSLNPGTFIGSTFARNTAGGRGGGLYIWSGSDMECANGILWNNEPDQVFVETREDEVSLHHSIVQGGYAGEGNMDVDPQFVDPDAGDFRLLPTSPAINAGDPDFEAEPGDADLDGHSRVLWDRVDIGAYEFGIGDFDCNRDVSLDDFGGWDDCFTGPGGGPYPATCEAFDFDADQDVDLRDFAGFAARYPN